MSNDAAIDRGRLRNRSKVISIQEAAALVPDGARIAFGGGGALMRRPMAFVRELARTGVKDLDVFQFLATLETDLLLGVDAVRSTNCTYMGLLEYGPAPNFLRSIRENKLKVNEYSEYMFMAGLRAADMGIPFIPWKTPWKSDLVENLGFAEVADPYSDARCLAIPALELDFAVIHANKVDEEGYLEAPDEPDLIWDYDYLIARVAKTTIICAEEVGPLKDPARVALIGAEVKHVVSIPGGAWPTGLHPRYQQDAAHVRDFYVPAAMAGRGEFRSYLDEYSSHEGRVKFNG
jgi:glutaconate CoA-transferase subunit A